MPIRIDSTPDARIAEMRDGFLQDAADLWDKQQERFTTLLETSDAKAVKLTFTATIDFSDSEATMETDLGFGQRFKDKRTRTFGDPDQQTMPTILNGDEHESAEEQPKRRGRKPKAQEEAVAAE